MFFTTGRWTHLGSELLTRARARADGVPHMKAGAEKMTMAALLEQVIAAERTDLDVTGDRFGCGAKDERERRACSLYLWLLGHTTEQLATTCPCQGS